MAKSIGLALGSGGARGWAHIGVLRALEEADIRVDYLAGSSIGAFVGALYAAEALDDLEEFATEISWRTIVSLLDVAFPNRGLLDGDKIYDLLTSHLLDLCIEDAKIPFRCVATDIMLGREVIIQSGCMVDAVRASVSIPGVFTPFQRNDIYLVDGGVVNPVPVSVVKEMGADVIIAVNLNRNYGEAERNQVGENCAGIGSEPLDTDTGGEPINDSESESQEVRQQRSQIMMGLMSRYESVRDLLQDKIEAWMPEQKVGLNIFDVIGNSINIMEQRVTTINLEMCPPDVLIEPDLASFGIFDFHQAQPIIQQGYRQTQAMLPQIEQMLAVATSTSNGDRP